MTTARPPPLTILLSESAERPFLALPPVVRDQLRRIFEGIAELAAVAPPIDPIWRKLPYVGRPMLRFTHGYTEVFYEVDLDGHTLRIVGVREAQRTGEVA